MNHVVPGIAVQPEPRRDVSLERRGIVTLKPRRRSLRRLLAALAGRRSHHGATAPSPRPHYDRGVTPVAGATSRGIAFLVNR